MEFVTTDTPQQARIVRSGKAAKWVRKNFPAGTRVVVLRGAGLEPEPGAMTGFVLRHVPGLNSQGGYLVVAWDNGHTGRVSGGGVAHAPVDGFYRLVANDARVRVAKDGCVRVHAATTTSNPYQPSHKWFVVARPAKPHVYVARKLREGVWVREES